MNAGQNLQLNEQNLYDGLEQEWLLVRRGILAYGIGLCESETSDIGLCESDQDWMNLTSLTDQEQILTGLSYYFRAANLFGRL